jgi:hypothetical protein
VWLDKLGTPRPKHKCSDWIAQEEKDLARAVLGAKLLAASAAAIPASLTTRHFSLTDSSDFN